MKYLNLSKALAFVSVLTCAAPVMAQNMGDAKPVGTYGAWSVFTFDDKGSKACFMSSKPESTESSVKNIKRGEAFAFITHWTADGTKNVFSVAAGFAYNDKTSPVVTIDGAEFSLLTRGETAWAPDQEADDKIAAALQKGQNLKVVSVSKRGTKITDTYSLKGSAEAYKAMTDACTQ